MGMDLGRLLRTGAKGMGIGSGSDRQRRPPASGGSSSAGPFPAPSGRSRSAVSRGGSRSSAIAGGCRRSAPRPPPTSGSARASATARTASGRCEVQRRVCSGRVSEIAGRDGTAGRPPDANAGSAPRGAARGGGARRRPAAPARRLLRRPQRGGANRASAPPAEFQLLRLDFEPWRPADMLAGGKLLSFGLSTNWERELLRADLVRELGEERAAKIDPTYPKGNPVVLHPGQGFDGDGLRLAEQIGRVREQIGLAAAASGSNNWAVTPARSATGGALLAGDPHLPSGMPGVWYEVGLELGRALLPRRLDPGPAGHLPGPEQRRRLRLHQRDGGRRGPLRRADRGRELRVRGRAAAARDHRGADRRSRAGPGRAARGPPHPPRPDRQPGARRGRRSSRSRCAGPALDEPAISHAHVGVLEPRSGPELVELLRDGHDAGLEPGLGRPARIDRLQDDRPDPDAEGRLPRPAEARLDGRVRVGRTGFPTTSCPSWSTPTRATSSPPTTGSSTTTTPTTSPATGWTATARARIEQLLAGDATSTTSTTSAAMQTDLYSIPGDEVVQRLARLEPTSQREVSAIERLKSWDRTAERPDRRGDDLPGLPAAAGARVHPRRDRRPRPRRALARPRRQRLHRPRHLALALALPPARALGGGRRGADRRLLGRARRSRPCAARSTTSRSASGPIPSGWRWGRVHELRVPARAGGGQPASPSGSSTARSTPAARRRPSPRSPTTRTTPTRRSGRRAGAWSPTRRRPSARAGRRSPASRGTPGAATTTTCSPAGRRATTQPMAGEGPFETLVLSPPPAECPPAATRSSSPRTSSAS